MFHVDSTNPVTVLARFECKFFKSVIKIDLASWVYEIVVGSPAKQAGQRKLIDISISHRYTLKIGEQ